MDPICTAQPMCVNTHKYKHYYSYILSFPFSCLQAPRSILHATMQARASNASCRVSPCQIHRHIMQIRVITISGHRGSSPHSAWHGEFLSQRNRRCENAAIVSHAPFSKTHCIPHAPCSGVLRLTGSFEIFNGIWEIFNAAPDAGVRHHQAQKTQRPQRFGV